MRGYIQLRPAARTRPHEVYESCQLRGQQRRTKRPTTRGHYRQQQQQQQQHGVRAVLRQIRPLVCRIQYIRRTVAAASLAASLHVRSADELIYRASLRSIPSRRQSTELASNALAPRTS